MPKDWVCSICQYSNPDDTSFFCGRCGNRRPVFIGVDFGQFKAGPGSASYTYSTTASNAAAGWGTVSLFEFLTRKGYPPEEMTALANAAEKSKKETPELWKFIEETLKESYEERVARNKEMDRSRIVKDIITHMTYANYLFWNKRKAKLFVDKGEIYKELLGPCPNAVDFATKIQSLASLFEVDLKPLRQLFPEYDEDWKSITLIQKILENEKTQFDPCMIDIWENIIKLRNAPPAHARDQPIEAYNFFGKSFPVRDYQQLWDHILDRFLTSLVKFLEVLDRLPEEVHPERMQP